MEKANQHSTTIGYALTNSLRHGYKLDTLKHDIMAALVVSLVALPLSMALSIAVGLPPQHGLYTAIVAGLIVPLLGGSVAQVTGPTAAFVVVIAPIVTQHGLRGLIITTVIAGLILVALGLAKLGRYIRYVPYPVTTGFTSGIAVVIGTLALNDFLGLHIASLQGDYIDKISTIAAHMRYMYLPEAFVGVVSLIIMATSHKLTTKVPPPVLGISVGVLLAYFMQQYGYDIMTIGSKFTYVMDDDTIGHGIPSVMPALHIPGLDSSKLFALPTMKEIKILMMPALVVAALGALESLLSAAVADTMSGTKHHPNSELIGVGIGNILSGLFAGIPATGAIARTATNINSGAKTPLASSFHAIFILLYVLLLAPLMSYIPMASLAALLMVVAYRMSHWRQFKTTLEVAPRSDSVVLIACFGFTVFIDMVAGVTVGIILACFLLLKRITNLTKVDVSHSSTGHHHKIKHLTIPDDMMVYHIDGSLFFGTAEQAFDRMDFVKDINTLVIDMENVPLIDMTGLIAMKTMILDMHSRQINVVLCGASEITDSIMRKVPSHIKHLVSVCSSIEEAVLLKQSNHFHSNKEEKYT
jgi:SulP family sulfate permease